MARSDYASVLRAEKIAGDPAERRMTTRLYEYWDALRAGGAYPSRRRFSVEAVPSLIEYGFTFVLDTGGIGKGPVYQFLGSELKRLVRTDLKNKPLSETPEGSLVSAVVKKHDMVLERKSPVSFEAELVDKWGQFFCFRATMLPFSENGADIDCIVGAITYRHESSKTTSSVLALEANKELTPSAPQGIATPAAEPAATGQAGRPFAAEPAPTEPSPTEPAPTEPSPTEQNTDLGATPPASPMATPTEATPTEAVPPAVTPAESAPAATADSTQEPGGKLADSLDECRHLAAEFQTSRGQSRVALYQTLERAYHFHFETLPDKSAYEALCAAADIKLQERTPFTGLIKLVFGKDYEKTRVSEYATCLSYANRKGRKADELTALIEATEGGIKGCVKAERLARRGMGRKNDDGLAQAKELLRTLDPLADLPDQANGKDEFVLLLARRDPRNHGKLEILGSLQEKPGIVEPMIKRAAKALKPRGKSKA